MTPYRLPGVHDRIVHDLLGAGLQGTMNVRQPWEAGSLRGPIVVAHGSREQAARKFR